MDEEKSSPEEGQLADTEWEYEHSIVGPILLQELPAQRLSNMVAFALRDGASPMEIREATEWLTKRQDWIGEVVYQDDHGFLTRQPYDLADGDEYTYEWVEGSCLLVINKGSLEQWGHSMIANYGWRIVAQWT